jgi:hypothetical protein
VVCEYLNARADDEHHEEEVQKVASPEGNPVDGLAEQEHLGIARRNPAPSATRAGLGYGEDQKHEHDRYDPKDIDPASPYRIRGTTRLGR